jgi:hypothetical protein
VESLVYERDLMIKGLPWYHFVHIVRFTLDPGTDDRPALKALLRTQQYDDAYEGPCGVGEGRHGPYLLETVTVESFDARTAGSVRSQINEWLALANEEPSPDPADPANASLPPDPTVKPMLNEHVFSTLAAADALYELVLPETVEGPDWRVGRQNGFHEFIAIDRDADLLTLLVCTDD